MKTPFLFILTVLGIVACGGPEEVPGRSHGVKVPLVIDGVRYSPAEVDALFPDAQLSFFIDKEAQDQGFVYAFTSEADQKTFRDRWALEHPREVQAAALSDSVFYEHINNSGASFTLAEHTLEPDLRSVCRWFTCTDWNDKISSVTPSRTNRFTTLYEHINYYGRSYSMANNVFQVNLTDVNFNDLASSITYVY